MNDSLEAAIGTEQYSQEYTLDMDQSAVYYSMHEKCILSVESVSKLI